MVSRRITVRRKLQILRTLINSKLVKKSSIIMDAYLYIYNLKLQVEAIKKEYEYLINHIQEVKVEKVAGTGFVAVMVTCKKGEELLVSILEALEKMNLNVIQARFTCKHFFGMEAVVEAVGGDDNCVAVLNETILNVVRTHT